MAALVFSPAEPQDGPEGHSAPTNNQSPGGYKPPEWVLPLVGIITALIVGWQSWETRKAAQATKKSAATMEGQTGILEKSVAAAEANARAAEKSIEIMVSKERARIRVVVDPWAPIIGVDPVTYTIHLDGPTQAYIVNASALAYIGDNTDFFSSMSIPGEVILPTSPALKQTAFIWPVIKFSQTDIDAIGEGRSIVRFQGNITYEDILGDNHITSFSYRWKPSWLYGPYVSGQPLLGIWEPEQNSDTEAN